MKYWIEVYFANGKTLRKESDNINDSYVVYNRYCCNNPNKKHAVQKVVTGNQFGTTFECNHVDGVCM